MNWEDPYQVAEFLGLGSLPWQQTKGARGYQDRLHFNAISIHHHGCRAFEILSTLPGDKWQSLLSTILAQGMHLTQLDVAYDDHTGTLDIDQIIQNTRRKEYVSRSDYWEIVESSKGQTVQFGSPKSDTRIRIYDKARERNCPAGKPIVV